LERYDPQQENDMKKSYKKGVRLIRFPDGRVARFHKPGTKAYAKGAAKKRRMGKLLAKKFGFVRAKRRNPFHAETYVRKYKQEGLRAARYLIPARHGRGGRKLHPKSRRLREARAKVLRETKMLKQHFRINPGKTRPRHVFEKKKRKEYFVRFLQGGDSFIMATSKSDAHEKAYRKWPQYDVSELRLLEAKDLLGQDVNPRRAKRRNPQEAFNVYRKGRLIDTVFATGYTVEEMKRSLINHDGYPSDIRVTKRKAKR
jgi:hypothetical protein